MNTITTVRSLDQHPYDAPLDVRVTPDAAFEPTLADRMAVRLGTWLLARGDRRAARYARRLDRVARLNERDWRTSTEYVDVARSRLAVTANPSGIYR